jgi:hypothetical protein
MLEEHVQKDDGQVEEVVSIPVPSHLEEEPEGFLD